MTSFPKVDPVLRCKSAQLLEPCISIYLYSVSIYSPSSQGKWKLEDTFPAHLLCIPQADFSTLFLHNIHPWDSLCKLLGNILTLGISLTFFKFICVFVWYFAYCLSSQVNLIFIFFHSHYSIFPFIFDTHLSNQFAYTFSSFTRKRKTKVS